MKSWCSLVAALFCALVVQGADTKTKARLVLDHDAARPGDTVLAGLELAMPGNWHTYWRNGGDAGLATGIKWSLPAGIKAGDIQWPPPEKDIQAVADLSQITYVYRKTVVLLVPLTLDASLAPGKHTLKGLASWLECDVSCVPGDGQVEAVLEVLPKDSPARASSSAPMLADWSRRLPQPLPPGAASAAWEKALSADARMVLLNWSPDKSGGAAIDPATADFFPYGGDNFDVTNSTERVTADAGKVTLRKLVTRNEGEWPKELAGLFVGRTTAGAEVAYEARLAVTGGEVMAAPVVAGKGVATGDAGGEKLTLAVALLFAFLGGMILNIMPCVLPVIALKILGFVGQGNSAPGAVRKLGLIYGLGVLVSFLVLALVIVGLKLAGQAASWGVQLQNPIAVIVLLTLVTLVALNLFGVFEVTLGGGAMGKASELAAKEGPAGAFFNGVLATVLATPCTAPFLGGAVGFAFTQPAAVIVLIFLTVGVGLALPYVALCWQPAWLKYLPKPGAWMEKFKIAMGFPMLATAIWLFTLATPHYREGADLWLGLFLVILALGAWVWGEFVQRGRKGQGWAMAACAVIVLFAYAYVLEGRLRWRSEPVETATGPGIVKEGADGIEWLRWSPEAVAAARAQGRPILVDFTAKWCLTCQLNKSRAIEVPSVREKLKQINAVALIENSIRKNEQVITELQRYQRPGVPLVLVYPKDASKEPLVLPNLLLTPDPVLEALDKAAL